MQIRLTLLALIPAIILILSCSDSSSGGSPSPGLGNTGPASADQCCVAAVGPESFCQCSSGAEPSCSCHGAPDLSCSITAGTCGGNPPGPTPQPGDAKVLIELESPGWDLADFHGLPTNLGQHFSTGAIITPFDGSSTTSASTAWTEGCTKLNSVGVASCEHWLGLYLGYDAGGHLTDCNQHMCHYDSNGHCTKVANPNAGITSCAAGVGQVWDLFANKGLTIHGLSVDNEGTSKDIFVPALDEFRQSIVAAGGNLQLGSTKTIQDMLNPTPSNVGGASWDYSLGQFYTIGYPTNLYANTCNLKPGFWDWVQDNYGSDLNTPPGAAFWSSYRVPMLCGAGDCQDCIGIQGCQTGTQCLDNRLGPTEIATLLDQRPTNFPLENLAIWYGVRPVAPAPCCYSNAASTNQCVDGPWVASGC